MLKVAGRPIIERLVYHLVGYGIRRIFISTNYLAEII
jgi:NDP-sugar pyrophosphorylase family protein